MTCHSNVIPTHNTSSTVSQRVCLFQLCCLNLIIKTKKVFQSMIMLLCGRTCAYPSRSSSQRQFETCFLEKILLSLQHFIAKDHLFDNYLFITFPFWCDVNNNIRYNHNFICLSLQLLLGLLHQDHQNIFFLLSSVKTSLTWNILS